MTIFEFTDYKAFVNKWVKDQPKKGFGLYSRMAESLSTSSVVISQIFKGSRQLTLEQTTSLARILALNSLETDYLLALVQKERAGSFELQKLFERQLKELRAKGSMIKNRIAHHQLSEEDRLLFYSSWHYIAIWLYASVEEVTSNIQISKTLEINEDRTSEILKFLLDKGLLLKKNRGFELGQTVIHLPHDSPYILKHHLNWRMRALQMMEIPCEESLHYSAPMALSAELSLSLKEELVQFIESLTSRVQKSPSEKLQCLNIDWFKVTKK